MDRAELSAAIIADAGETVMTLLREALPGLLSADLAGMERQLQALGRVLWGHVVEALIGVRARDEEGAPSCASCGQPMRRADAARPRRLQGLVGDYTLRRAYYHCASCGEGQAPLDAQLGMGRGMLSPELLRVVCRAGVEEAFAEAAALVQEALGVWVSADSVERGTERMGAVAEACVQEAIGRVKQGQAVWSDAQIEAPPAHGVLAVEVDGVQVHRDDGWHEMKVVTVAPLGPALHHEHARGRTRTQLAWGAASYGAGFEEAEDFWYRAYVEACHRGLGTPAVHTVVVLGDGAEWIWHRAAAFLGGAGVEVVEIVDIYHAYEYLWSVGHALFGVGTVEAVRWVEALKDQLYERGVAPVVAALAASHPPSAEAAEVVRVAHGYFTTQAARMDYPRFVARQFPIGSGAVESTCKSLVEARAKQAGMRWSRAGAQAVLSLRALLRSGGWAAFWRTQPQRGHLHLCPRVRRGPRPQPAPTSPPATGSMAVLCPPPAPGPRSRPTPTARQRPLLLPRSA